MNGGARSVRSDSLLEREIVGRVSAIRRPRLAWVAGQNSLTVTGIGLCVRLPSPNWPGAFLPQHFAVPPLSRAQE